MKQLFLLLLITTFCVTAHAKTETAIFSAGCFWGVEDYFRKVPGVLETRVGYTGGQSKTRPSYELVAGGNTGNAESVELTFDPAKVSYADLLKRFFKMHDPTTLNQQGNDAGSQYRSAIFYQNNDQKAVAEKIKTKAAVAWKKSISTEISKADTFWPAEDYHQKYLVKHPGGYDNHFERKLVIE
jgi:methionine-S-sulfoxide reductase